ncbi:hypothetical protein B7P43_G16244, partial [Cryptotermes secundus]
NVRSLYRVGSLRAVAEEILNFEVYLISDHSRQQIVVLTTTRWWQRFSALENLDTEVDINKTWETIREKIKMSAKDSLGYYEPKKHKPWFDEGCSKFLDQRKQAKLQWLQDPSELTGDNPNNIKREISRNFSNKQREYLKDKIDELAMNSTNKNIKRPVDVRQTEIDTAEPLIPDLSLFDVESAIAKLKRYKSPGSDQIPTELIQAGGKILRSKIHNLIIFIWHEVKLPDQWKESSIVPVHKKGDKTDCSNYWGISAINFIQNFIQYSSLKVKSIYR